MKPTSEIHVSTRVDITGKESGSGLLSSRSGLDNDYVREFEVLATFE